VDHGAVIGNQTDVPDAVFGAVFVKIARAGFKNQRPGFGTIEFYAKGLLLNGASRNPNSAQSKKVLHQTGTIYCLGRIFGMQAASVEHVPPSD